MMSAGEETFASSPEGIEIEVMVLLRCMGLINITIDATNMGAKQQMKNIEVFV
jgi:hypothetical protein